MSSRPSRLVLAALACALTGTSALPAGADHTDPLTQLSPIVSEGPVALTSGAGTWTHVESFGGASTGTDLEFFHRDGALYASGGQLGQAPLLSVGQRIIKLVDADGNADNPEWVADHGSGSCGDASNFSATTGLQHDTQTTPRATTIIGPGPKPDAELIIDNVDALGRCHDAPGGGLELIDVSGLGEEGFEPREIHLTRHNGYSHTMTVDATRPWIVYNSTSDFGTDPDAENPKGIGKSWIDVLDIRTCLGLGGKSLEDKRKDCRPKVYRIPFQYDWSTQEKENGTEFRQPSACHDITTRPGRLYCAALNATIAFDVSGLTVAQGPDIPGPNEAAGDIKGTPLPCEVTTATPAQNTDPTGAMVTDCALGDPNDAVKSIQAWVEEGKPSAAGWKYLGHVNHPGRECNAGSTYTCNTNLVTPSDEGVAVSHESDPSPGGRYLFVTDERGGGIVPPGATCLPTVDNPYGNGGLHVFDMQKKDDKGRFTYAPMKGGGKAVFITGEKTVTPTFCTIHVIEQIPDEQRIVAAWYTQGVKIIDYEIDPDTGEWTFTEVASYVLEPNDIWAVEAFKIEDEGDGNRTYHFLSNDVERGLDVFTWTGPKGPALQNEGAIKTPTTGGNTGGGTGGGGGTRPDEPAHPATGADLTLLALAMLLLPAAVVVRRRLART